MRILRIRLRNLNSLKGEHQLDLTDEPLASAGLFAITGPTGAGKTTLLDAVTLALYGKAARYGNESNPEHVMTRHCGECSAEVEFEVPSGVYRAVWERHRAGKKADGRLQQPKRYIYDIDGEPLAQQIREAEDKIEELLGLDYDRFLRSVLLAQGDFARFLKAKPDKRAELLESLTGTAIYSRLGKLAHTEARQMEDDLRSKDASLDLIEILEEEARQELEAALQEGDKQRASLTTAIKAGAEMLDKINTLERARRDEKRAADEQAAIGSDRQSAAEDLERLRTHRLTLPFAEDLARLESAESARRSAAENRKRTDAAHAAATKTLIQSNHILRTAIEAALEDCRERANSAGESAAEAAIVASDARSWLDEHQYDTSLDHQLGDVVAAIGELKSSRASLDSDWARWRSVAVAALSDAASGLPEQLDSMTESEAGPILADLLKKAGSEQEALDAEEKEARNQNGLRKDHLEKAKLVASLKDHRHTLKSGEPCPLCGALEHPYAETGAPKSEISALEEELEKAGEKLEKVRESYRAFTGTLKDLMSRKERILEGIRHSVAYRENLDVLLRPLGAEPPAPGSEDTLRTELQDRVRAYRQRSEAETDARKRQETADRTAKEAAREAKAFEKKLGKLPALPTDAILESLPAEELPGVAEAEEAYVDSVSQERTTSAQAADRKDDEEKAAQTLEDVKQPLEDSIAGSEFETLEALIAAKRPAPEAERIEKLDASLNNRETEAGALLKQARAAIGTLLEDEVLEGEEAHSFKESHGKLKEDRDQLLEDQATRRNQLKTDDESSKLRKEREAELQEDRKNLVVWRRLRELIGSHDGSKFRRYAQAISLDILTRHANRHLERLSDRYQICRDEAETLNLQIEDLHQAGVKRPVASLSGGESFLVSLALALGLSDLAGRTVRIDSLFIDEGFGSLDTETLEIAISALESLRQDHKTVGVISHVPLLKERIATQVIVEKKAGGLSQIRVIPPQTGSRAISPSPARTDS